MLLRKEIAAGGVALRIGLSASLTVLAGVGAGQTPMTAIAHAPHLESFQRLSTPVDPGKPVSVGIRLSGFDKAAADEFVASQYDQSSPNFGHWIDAKTFAKRFGAPDSDIAAITAYLRDQGFTNIHVGAGKTYISALGTAAVVSKAFDTSFGTFARPSEMVARGEEPQFFGPASPVRLPYYLVSKVDGIFGLGNLEELHPAGLMRGSKKQGVFGYTPSQITNAYDSQGLESSVHGAGMKIAVYSPTNWYSDDPYYFASDNHIPWDFVLFDVLVDGGATTYANPLEASCDAEVIVGQAYKAHIYMVESPLDGIGELDSIDWVASVGDFSAMSSSWYHEESAFVRAGDQSAANTISDAFEVVASEGTSIFIAAGDSAAFEPGTGDVSVEMEAASPYVTAVGGTSLTIDNDEYGSETLWSYSGSPKSAIGGGGGVSQLFKKPSWQAGYGVIGFAGREVPDVSAVAAQNTPWAVIYQGKPDSIGGTSLAAPLWAVNTMLINESLQETTGSYFRMGLLNPSLYRIGNWFENPNVNWTTGFVLHDITEGNNGVYKTTAGYDNCAGWGSARFGRLLNDLGFTYGVNTYAPDYAPYQPSEWNHPIMFNARAGVVGEPSAFEAGAAYYVGIASSNYGRADGPAAPFQISVDGRVVVNGQFPSMPLGTTYDWTDYTAMSFPKGVHTIKFAVNIGPAWRETNSSNNSYVRTITVN